MSAYIAFNPFNSSRSLASTYFKDGPFKPGKKEVFTTNGYCCRNFFIFIK